MKNEKNYSILKNCKQLYLGPKEKKDSLNIKCSIDNTVL